MEGAHLTNIGEQVSLTYPAERLGEGRPLPLQWCPRGHPSSKNSSSWQRCPATVIWCALLQATQGVHGGLAPGQHRGAG